MTQRRVLPVIGVLLVSCIFGVSCAPIEATGSGPVYGQTEPLPGPPSGDFAQAVLDQRADYRRTMGKGLRDKAHGLQQRGLFREAVAKYRESLTWWPDPGLDGYIAMVERAARLPSTSGTTSSIQTPGSTVRSGEVVATIRNRSERDVYIFAARRVESPRRFFCRVRFVRSPCP